MCLGVCIYIYIYVCVCVIYMHTWIFQYWVLFMNFLDLFLGTKNYRNQSNSGGHRSPAPFQWKYVHSLKRSQPLKAPENRPKWPQKETNSSIPVPSIFRGENDVSFREGNYLEPFDDPCFDWKFGLLLGGWPSKIEVMAGLSVYIIIHTCI